MGSTGFGQHSLTVHIDSVLAQGVAEFGGENGSSAQGDKDVVIAAHERTGRSSAGTVTASIPAPHEAVPIPRWMGPVPWALARCSDRAMIARARSRARPSAMVRG